MHDWQVRFLGFSSVMRTWLTSGPTAGFNSLVVLAVLGILAELYGDAFPDWTKFIVIAIVVMLSVNVFSVQFKRPAMEAEEVYRDQLMVILFGVIIERYRDQNPGDYDLRINVMSIRRRFGFPRYLAMDYCTDDYPASEMVQEYRVGTGCCGWAFERNAQMIFDKATNQEALKDMTEAQREATAHVHSILSTPIYRHRRLDDPIGVLSLDSTAPIAKTKFDDDTMQNLVMQYASIIGAFLR